MGSPSANLGAMNSIFLDEGYRSLPYLYLTFALIWSFLSLSWTINTYRARAFQMNKLQWVLASVPFIKALQQAFSFLFWYSCFNLQTCSLWMSFGVYVTGALYQTAAYVSFLLISHGYCIMCERLSLPERRSTAALGCAFYLTLVGYRASVPCFSVFLVLNYLASFYLIFHHISRNLMALREQLSYTADEDVYLMRNAVIEKYIMFKKFQAAMRIMVFAEIGVPIIFNLDGSSNDYWVRLLVREWSHFCIFLYIGWTFRSQDLVPRFSVMPTIKSKGKATVPPIYSIEMDAATFKDFSSHEWHIGVPTVTVQSNGINSNNLVPVIIQNPRACRLTSVKIILPSSDDVKINM